MDETIKKYTEELEKQIIELIHLAGFKGQDARKKYREIMENIDHLTYLKKKKNQMLLEKER